jgi:hypothetical protein
MNPQEIDQLAKRWASIDFDSHLHNDIAAAPSVEVERQRVAA